MSDYKSDQLTNAEGFPMTPTKSYEQGRPVTEVFTYTVPSGGITTTDRVKLVTIPKGAVLLDGRFVHDGLGNNVALGDGTTDDKYLASVSVASAGSVAFFVTIALGYQTQLADETSIWATPKTNAWTAGKVIKGHVTYMMGG